MQKYYSKMEFKLFSPQMGLKAHGLQQQAAPLTVCVLGRGVALHDDLLTQDPPSARTCHRLLPLESRQEGRVLLGWESLSVCVFLLWLQGHKPSSKMPSSMSTCQPLPPRFQSDKGPFSALKCCSENGKWWSIIYGKGLSDIAQTGEQKVEN